ncbi:ABC transporter substrate-binding protein [Glutamicibacter creatinolyticus]|uniref:ABC transporter substrate-binding protein n=1 Tax=Glutamicibacter creatinolyticus TaxID=162496 RepID=UPI00340F32DE
MSSKKMLATVSIAALSLSLAACSTGRGTEGTGQNVEGCGNGEGLVVNLSNPTQPVSLDGNYDTLIPFQQINRNLYDGLFKLDNDMQVQPSLATEFTLDDDGITYHFMLRDDVTFHDGSSFTADDVVSTFERIATDEELSSRQRNYISNVEQVTKTDAHEVQITLKQPDASFISTLATSIYITPAQAVEEKGAAFGQSPVGSGPFKFASWNQGDSVVLTANCDYWGSETIPSQVEFRFISEPATQISSLQSGEIDIATGVTPDLANVIEGSPDVAVKSVEGNQAIWLAFNTLEGPFADAKVRQAVNYAIDKEAITDSLLDGYATPLGQLYGSSIFGHSQNVDPYPYNPDRAKELLAEAGYEDGELSVEFVLYYDYLNTVQQNVASYLEAVGIKVTSRTDPNFFSDTWLQNKMGSGQVFLASNTNILMDADYPLGLWFDGARRGLYFHTPETDAAIAKARSTADSEERQQVYDELNELFYEKAPAAFMYNTDAIYGTSDRINWEPRSDGAIYLADVTKTR